MSYIKRTITESIHYLLSAFPVVAVLGARQVGKSTLIRHILPDAEFFDLERDDDYFRINNDPRLLLQEIDRPIIFDEAQLSTRLFRALRVAIDQQRELMGQFLLSGFSSPQLLQQISETLAGRVAIVELDPLSWHEIIQTSNPNSFISALNHPEELLKLQPRISKPELLKCCLYGGYPEPVLKKQDDKYFRLWMENYLKTYVERDIRLLFPQLNLDAYKRFIQMLAFASGEIINAANFSRSLGVSQPTIKHYLEIIEGTFLWRKIPSYEKNVRKRIIKMPKGHLRDTGLINYFLRLKTENDMKSHPQFGRIWEIFIIEQIIRHFKNNLERVEYFYYRTQNQAEIDLVLETDQGLIPIEIKSSSIVSKRQLISLETFIKEHQCPYGLVVNNGDNIYKLSESIVQLPAIYL
jgi:uncharacterized protein